MFFQKKVIISFLSILFISIGVLRYPYYVQDIDLGSIGPNFCHWFGTDQLGRDIFSRVIYACFISLSIGFIATFFSVFIGVIYGICAGYFGGFVDTLLMRFIDVIYPIPLTLIVILLMILLGQHIFVLFFAIGLVEWMTTARIIRSEVLKIKECGYIYVARGLGQTKFSIIIYHVLPNLKHLIVVCFVITLPGVILLESFLSFIGLGIQPPQSSLGILICEGAKRMGSCPWEIIFPAGIMVLIMFILTYIGNFMQKNK